MEISPIALAYVSSSLKKAGYSVVTSNLEYRQESTMSSLRHLIESQGIDIVCTSGLSRDFHKVKEIVGCTQTINKGIRSIVGGGIITSATPRRLSLHWEQTLGS
jgi:hypothetical protein